MTLCVVLSLFAADPGEARGGSAYSSVVQSQDPIGYWRFNDGATATRLDIAENSGSLGSPANGLYSGASHPVPGVLLSGHDTAARMAGGQNIRIPWSPALNPSSPFTVEGWFRPAALSTVLGSCVMSSGHFESPRSGWLIYQLPTGFNFRMYSGIGTATSVNITGGGFLIPGKWYHVAVSYTGTAAILYINGVKVTEGQMTGFVSAVDGELTIGIRSDNSLGWSGDADEIAVYNTALSPDRIQAHFANANDALATTSYPLLIQADAPLGYWRLGEASFAADVALNSGSQGPTLNGSYQGGALSSTEAPRSPGFLGFESDNTSVAFDGKESFVALVPGLLNGQDRFTFSGWVRPDTAPAPLSGLWGQHDLFEFGFPDADTLEVWTGGALSIPNPIPPQQWSHVAIVSEGPRLMLYTNGSLAATRSQSLRGSNSFSFNIGGGGIFDGGGDFFQGEVDELAFFDKPLSAVQICNQYFSTVPKAPEIFSVPAPITLFAGFPIHATVEVCGSTDLQRQWFKSPHLLLDSQTNFSLLFAQAQESDTGLYFLRVTNLYGKAESTPVAITVLPAHPPIFDQQPAGGSRYAGFRFELKASVSGTLPIQYQWQHDGVDLAGATNAFLQWPAVRTTDAGRYRLTVRNPITNALSDEVLFNVIVPAEGSYEADIVRGHPIAYWRLNESGGPVAYDFAGGWDGEYHNTTLGLPGALSSDNQLSASLPGPGSGITTTLSSVGGSAFTWMAWFRPSATTLQPSTNTLLTQPGQLELSIQNGDSLQCQGLRLSSRSVVSHKLTSGEWSFIVVEGDSTGMKFYANGVLIASDTQNIPTPQSALAAFTIGSSLVNPLIPGFVGGVDEVAVFDRALTTEQICHLYYKAAGTPFHLDIRGATSQQVILSWSCGSVQEADELAVSGPTVWRDRPEFTSPFTIKATGARKYYRIQP